MPEGKVIEVTLDNFVETVSHSELPVVLEFWSPECKFCIKMAKVLDKLVVEYAGRAVVGKVNTLEQLSLTRAFGVDGLPAFFMIRDNEVKAMTTGAMSKGVLKKRLGL